MPHDVFISYSSKDKSIADAVCAGLEAGGVRCWIAPRDVLGGQTWAGAIVAAIRGAYAMVLIVSAHFNTSPQVLNEVERAVHEEKIIIPFRIEAITLSGDMEYFLSRRHWLDALTPPLVKHIASLVGTAQALIRQRDADAQSGSPCAAAKSVAFVPSSPERTFVGEWPVFTGECVGYQEWRQDLSRLLIQDRVVAISGRPGVGKTRLICEFAQEHEALYSGGLVFLDFSALNPGQRPETLAAHLDVLTAGQKRNTTLIVLDRCEALSSAVSQELLRYVQRHAHVHIVCISRRMSPEMQNVTLSDLSVGEHIELHSDVRLVDEIKRIPAVEFFLSKAKLKNPKFRIDEDNALTVLALCRKLAGNPRAIEVAARRANRSLEDLVEFVDEWVEHSGEPEPDAEGAAPDDRTVGRCVELLSSDDVRRFLYRAALFDGEFALETYRTVVLRALGQNERSSSSALDELTDEGLILLGGNDLYGLPASVRIYALNKLRQSDEYPLLCASYEAWLNAQNDLVLPHEIGRTGTKTLHQRIEHSQEALRVADRIEATDPYAAAQVRFQRAGYLLISGRLLQSSRLLTQVLDYLPPKQRSEALFGLGLAQYMKCEFTLALPTARESAELAKEIDIQALATCAQGVLEGFVDGPSDAVRGLLDAGIKLADEAGDVWIIAYAHLSMATYLWHAADYAGSEQYYKIALDGFNQANDTILPVFALNSLAHLARRAGRNHESVLRYLDSMKLCRGWLFERGRAGCVLGTSGVALAHGRGDESVIFWGCAMRHYNRLGFKMIPPIERDYSREFDAHRAVLDGKEPGAFKRLYERGQRLSLAQAFERARELMTELREQHEL